jgi:hypothetical protein
MELNKENQHIVMQWNDSYFTPITAFLVCFAKNCSQRMVAKYSRSTVQRSNRMDVLFWCCHIAKVDY